MLKLKILKWKNYPETLDISKNQWRSTGGLVPQTKQEKLAKVSLWPKCHWPKCHSGQSVIGQSVTSQRVTGQNVSPAKVSLAKVSLAKVSLWPKCHSGQSVIQPKREEAAGPVFEKDFEIFTQVQ